MPERGLGRIRCVVFDFGGTLSSDPYFALCPPEFPQWSAVIQEHVFGQKQVLHAWMTGELSLEHIAGIVAEHIPMRIGDIIQTMERGCSRMTFNQAVWDFARTQRGEGRKTALVTADMDVFSTVVVPAHGLDSVFDLILNTSDHHELNKVVLWDRAFELLGDGISYRNSLLIEDGPKEPALFRAHGGTAYEYRGDEGFRDWLREMGWRG